MEVIIYKQKDHQDILESVSCAYRCMHYDTIHVSCKLCIAIPYDMIYRYSLSCVLVSSQYNK